LEFEKLNYKFKIRKLALENQQKLVKKLNDNEKLLKQKTVADNIRNITKGVTKSNFYPMSGRYKQNNNNNNVMKTEIDISNDYQENNVDAFDQK